MIERNGYIVTDLRDPREQSDQAAIDAYHSLIWRYSHRDGCDPFASLQWRKLEDGTWYHGTRQAARNEQTRRKLGPNDPLPFELQPGAAVARLSPQVRKDLSNLKSDWVRASW